MTDPGTTLDDTPTEAVLSVRVSDVVVRYRVFEEQRLSARQRLAHGFRSRRSTLVHAVNGVTFDVHQGESVGIVGSNGSGKSTLLRTIAGLQSCTEGQVLVRGSARLLGVNAVLKPELSGYRNIYLGGLAMGLSRREVDEALPGVEAFADIGEAMNRPMKTYSSGMRSRLAFAIATLRIPEVLLIDEALAVGDRTFRARSLERVRQIRDEAGTVIMVTHNLQEIRDTCTRAIWLDAGRVVVDGAIDDVLDRYEAAD